MVVLMVLLKVALHWLLSFYKAVRKLKTYGFLHKVPQKSTSNLSKCTTKFQGSAPQSLASNFYGTLLRPTPSHFFPYFMLVAFEGGSLLRALLLLLTSPLLWAFGWRSEVSLRIMVFVTFCGLKTKDVELVSRAVLPKFFLENLHLQGWEVVDLVKGRRVLFCGLPRVMFEGFAKEYLGVSEVLSTELQVVKGSNYFSGFVCCSGLDLKHKGLRMKEVFEEEKADVGLVSSYYNTHDHLLLSHCKEAYIISNTNTTSTMPRDKYPKPLVFHDSRLAFLPTPLSTLSLFLFLPFSIPLSIARIALGILPPYKIMFLLGALTGVHFRLHHHSKNTNTKTADKTHDKKGIVYVCTHRTLLDPVMLATALQRPVPAVTYSLSPISEAIAPMRTVRLTRNRESDSDTMLKLLSQGDLTICPEGTTCREPYLLRFSPLFAELADHIVPVAMDAKGSWFYGTTASGHKGLDPLYFFMNPIPSYRVELLEQVPREMTCAGGLSGSEVANLIQKQLGDSLGFECTGLTRRDKYMMLAGNEGIVKKTKESK
ncbi:glycerol-3-phosphate acyltransferase 1-like [Asparagus officinalis]|uniref:glycerol-3-phosphate acyltransferase 1-like n=1 Tax=Asparagus officinalis TaxID=4686 RepID=UPI00098E5005|nr:glycerol-3-phosphate acyltransferase 1-like [Asparagus officinalis]